MLRKRDVHTKNESKLFYEGNKGAERWAMPWPKYRTKHIARQERHLDDVWLKSPVIQKTFQAKNGASIAASVRHWVIPYQVHGKAVRRKTFANRGCSCVSTRLHSMSLCVVSSWNGISFYPQLHPYTQFLIWLLTLKTKQRMWSHVRDISGDRNNHTIYCNGKGTNVDQVLFQRTWYETRNTLKQNNFWSYTYFKCGKHIGKAAERKLTCGRGTGNCYTDEATRRGKSRC